MNKKLTLLLALAFSMTAALAQDVDAGSKKVAQCIGCHGIPGYQASFPEIHKVPMIAGQGAKFLEAALVAYKKGERKHPTMRAVAGSLSEQDMADLAAFYQQQGQDDGGAPSAASHAAPAEVAELLAKGACASCHGADYASPIDPSYPVLAGQHADYLYVALKAYKVEGNPNLGRSNAIMGGVAKQYSNAELKVLARYLSTLPGPLKTVQQSRFR